MNLINENEPMDWDMALAMIESKYDVECYARVPRVRFRSTNGKEVFDVSPKFLNRSWKEIQAMLEAGLRSGECTICCEVKNEERSDRKCAMTVCGTCKNILCRDCMLRIRDSKNCKTVISCPHCRTNLI